LILRGCHGKMGKLVCVKSTWNDSYISINKDACPSELLPVYPKGSSSVLKVKDYIIIF